jgi:hypothetical protein
MVGYYIAYKKTEAILNIVFLILRGCFVILLVMIFPNKWSQRGVEYTLEYNVTLCQRFSGL